MKRTWLGIGLALLTLVNVAALLKLGYGRWCAHHDAGTPLKVRGGHKELGLTPAQEAQIAPLREAMQAELARLRPALRAKREELVRLLATPEPDRAQVNEVASQINSLQAELQKAVLEHLLAEKKILTPAQQEKFLSIIRAKLIEEEREHGAHGLEPSRE
jgi:Spy/CpxP family protein refolding chaperone